MLEGGMPTCLAPEAQQRKHGPGVMSPFVERSLTLLGSISTFNELTSGSLETNALAYSLVECVSGGGVLGCGWGEGSLLRPQALRRFAFRGARG